MYFVVFVFAIFQQNGANNINGRPLDVLVTKTGGVEILMLELSGNSRQSPLLFNPLTQSYDSIFASAGAKRHFRISDMRANTIVRATHKNFFIHEKKWKTDC